MSLAETVIRLSPAADQTSFPHAGGEKKKKEKEKGYGSHL